MGFYKAKNTPLGEHFKLSSSREPYNKVEVRYMDKIPYSYIIGYLIYGMIYIRLD